MIYMYVLWIVVNYFYRFKYIGIIDSIIMCWFLFWLLWLYINKIFIVLIIVCLKFYFFYMIFIGVMRFLNGVVLGIVSGGGEL